MKNFSGDSSQSEKDKTINELSYYDVFFFFFHFFSGWRLRENHEWIALTTATEDVTTFKIASVYLL